MLKLESRVVEAYIRYPSTSLDKVRIAVVLAASTEDLNISIIPRLDIDR